VWQNDWQSEWEAEWRADEEWEAELKRSKAELTSEDELTPADEEPDMALCSKCMARQQKVIAVLNRESDLLEALKRERHLRQQLAQEIAQFRADRLKASKVPPRATATTQLAKKQIAP